MPEVIAVGEKEGLLARASLPFPILYEDEHLIVVNKPAVGLGYGVDGGLGLPASVGIVHMVT